MAKEKKTAAEKANETRKSKSDARKAAQENAPKYDRSAAAKKAWETRRKNAK